MVSKTAIAELVAELIYIDSRVADVSILYDYSVSVLMEDDTKFRLTIDQLEG